MNGPEGIPTAAVIDPFLGVLAVLERCGYEGQLECCAEQRHGAVEAHVAISVSVCRGAG